ncbi:MAG: tetratricopeptide repeat protein [Planctomyces sp.]|nr:tetratricopeptide repeat protein [Planctomyces sp.]
MTSSKDTHNVVSIPVDRIDLNDRAMKAVEEQRHDEAERLLTSAIEEAEAHQILDRCYAVCLSNLGRLHYEKGDYSKAEPILRHALEIDTKLDKNEGSTGTEGSMRSLLNLSALLKESRNYDEAESLLRRALEIAERLYGNSHVEVATVLNNLGATYRNNGKNRDAESCYLRALQIREQAQNPNDSDIAGLLGNLGLLCSETGRLTEAEHYFTRAITIEEAKNGGVSLRLATMINNLAFLRQDQGKFDDAAELFYRSLKMKEMAVGNNHPSVASTLFDLSALYWKQDRLNDSVPLLTRCLTIHEQSFGSDSTKLLVVLDNFALVQFARGQFVESEALYRQAAAIAENAYGNDDAAVAAERRWIAWCLDAQGLPDRAEPERKQADKVLRRYPVESTERRDAMRQKASTRMEAAEHFFESGNYYSALSTYLNAEAALEIADGMNSDNMAFCFESVGRSLRKLDCATGAIVFETEAAVIRARLR